MSGNNGMGSVRVSEKGRRATALVMAFVMIVCSIIVVMPTAMEEVSGETINVGCGGPGNYTTIQEAIDSTSKFEYDVIFVCSGTYNENININHSVILRGQDRDTTIIDGGGSGTVVTINVDSVKMRGFTIRGSGSKPEDAGIYLNSSKAAELENNNVTDNTIGIRLWNYGYEDFKKTGLENDEFGSSVAIAGDVNNDGYMDIIVGEEYGSITAGVPEGKAYVISGLGRNVIRTYGGENDGDNFGHSVDGAGDVNNDGYDDVIIGAPDAGKAYVYSGQTSELLYEHSGGNYVSGAGDVNNDGYDDFILGSSVFSGLNGNAIYWFGGDTASGVGDIDKDGYDDVLVGDPDYDFRIGKAVIYSGQTGGELFSFEGEGTYGYFGQVVSDAGDVDNDGWPDVIVAAHNPSYAWSYAKVFSGQTGQMLHNFVTPNPSIAYANSVSGAGDLDNDGYDDLIVGAVNDDDIDGWSAGAAYVYSGRTGHLMRKIRGTQASEFGTEVASGGDFDKDGFDEILIGAPEAYDGRGAIYAYSFNQFVESTSHQIIRNQINKNDDGLVLSETTDNTIYHNVFSSNSNQVSLSGLNTWNLDYPAGGNYWDTYPGSDVFSGPDQDLPGSDGIGDSAQVHGGGNIDYYPLMDGFDPEDMAPIIMSTDVTSTSEDAGYLVDYDAVSIDEELLVWSLWTDAPFLALNPISGVLSGFPINKDAGSWTVNVSVEGDNGGIGWHNFTLSVVNVEPVILTGDDTLQLVNIPYSTDYDSDDDGYGIESWSLETNASWLSIDSNTGVLSGLPLDGNMLYWVNVIVNDGRGGTDKHNFTLSIRATPVHNYARAVHYPTIQTALDDAEANGWFGDIIDVDGGVYVENIRINISLDVIGEGPDSTIIRGSNTGSVIQVSAPDVRIEGFTVKESGTLSGDAGILSTSKGTIIENNRIQNNNAGVYQKGHITEIEFTGSPDYEEEEFGFSVSGAGDFNNDGHDDVIIGAPHSKVNGYERGRVYIYSIHDDQTLYEFGPCTSPSCHFGYSVSDAGDVNKDGFSDVIIGAPYASTGYVNNGRAFVYSGATGSIIYAFPGIDDYEYLGKSVSGAGDVDNDGYDDMIVGVPDGSFEGSRLGRAQIYSGRTGAQLYQFVGETSNSEFGTSVSDAGDVNNDGYDDVIVGAKLSNKAYVYSGKNGSIIHTFSGLEGGDYFGGSVAGVGDVNCDGFDDLFVGAEEALNGGQAYVFSGKNGSNLYTFSGEVTGDDFGHSVSQAGDFNRDGYDDLMVSATGNDDYDWQAGKVFVYSGLDGSLLQSVIGKNQYHYFGGSISGAGDVNSDGFLDFIVGASFDHSNSLIGDAYIYLSGPADMLLKGNTLSNNDNGAVFENYDGGDLIYNNNFLSNTDHVVISNTSTWNESYAIGGNYWDNYAGIDVFSGPAQDIPGSDGIGDVPYTIDGLNSDFYPYVNEFYYGVHNPIITNSDIEGISEDQSYYVDYFAVDYDNDLLTWSLYTDSGFLGINTETGLLSGAPDNTHVGSWIVNVSVNDGNGGQDWTNFTLTVYNALPEILTGNHVGANVDMLYEVDYSSTDDGWGLESWSLATNASWLGIVEATGVLSGTPTEADVWYWVNVTVDDGNGGADWTNFTVTVCLSGLKWLAPGDNYLSFPKLQPDTTLDTVLASIAGQYDKVTVYDPTDAGDHWKDWTIYKPAWMSDLSDIDHTMGIYISITGPAGAILDIAGTEFTDSTNNIQLYTGWNHVGFPSLSDKTRDAGLNNLTIGVEIGGAYRYDSATDEWVEMTAGDDFVVGGAYRIYANQDYLWDVPL